MCWLDARAPPRVRPGGRGGSRGGVSAEELELSLGALARDALLVPHAAHLLELCLEVAHRLVHKQLLQGPFLDVARLVLFEVVDILNRAREDRALGLFA